MMAKETRYWHNFAEIVRPNQQLPSAKKTKVKRTAVERDEAEEEIIGEDDDENTLKTKRPK